jgi:cyclopropane-fatty-acyl-phospholipid synthase
MEWLLNHLGRPKVDIVLWDGIEIASLGPSVGRIHFSDPAFLKNMLLAPTIAFGDAYADGTVRIEGDLVDVLSEIYFSMRNAPPEGCLGWLLRIGAKASPHSVDHSRDNVHHHYDIGNDFYRLWLDERMLYTCAYYPDPDLALEEAQLAKMDHVCRKLRLQPGETVVEAGCGWGALALHMVEHYGVRVRAFNLSREQVAYAREQARQRGFADRAEFVQEDYRSATGSFDAFVSVGMLEHVGPENYRELGRVIDRVLAPGGRGLIHSIGRNAPRPMDAWIDRRIFPGAYPPALSEITDIFEPYDFSVLDVENLRLHYAKTLAHWLQRFDLNESEVLRMFDEKFVRTWRLYLAGSEASFRVGALQLFQILFCRAQNNSLPWSRRHLH